ncbi:CU044_5270 family protein [Actinomadura oligospora]|uniref:CU044_5270 family protein n=1 Tax=Actinomadura oligospora TaxID=111804 RepID=UPI00047C1E11|nr:CU044_5270 family protein [Actinomadura oligospora]
MNGTPRRGPEPDELSELVRLLPPPGDPELSAGRRRLLKDHLMLQIEEPATAPRRPKRRRPALLAVPLAAAAVAAGLFALPLGGHTSPSRPPAAGAGDQNNATVLLDRISLAAAHQTAPPVRDDQFVYIKSKVAWTSQEENGPRVLEPLREREIWLAQSVGGHGLLREGGRKLPLVGTGKDMTYRKLAALPTEPGALLDGVYAKIPKSGKTAAPSARDAAAFQALGQLLGEQILPPELAAAIYRAAARIPGVVVVPDSVDAAGRHGVAVALVAYGERNEWIFDRKTLTYLGERGSMVEDTKNAKKGMTTAITAILQRGVVNKAGQLPTKP